MVLAVQHRANGQGLWIGQFIAGDHHRSERTEGIEALAADPLSAPATFLPAPGRDIVGTGVGKDMRQCLLDCDISGGPADDHRELGLVVDLGAMFACCRQLYRGERRDHRGIRFHEQHGLLRQLRAGFGGMCPVVESDAVDSRRLERCEPLAHADACLAAPEAVVQGVALQYKAVFGAIGFNPAFLPMLIDAAANFHRVVL